MFIVDFIYLDNIYCFFFWGCINRMISKFLEYGKFCRAEELGGKNKYRIVVRIRENEVSVVRGVLIIFFKKAVKDGISVD